MKKRTRLLSLVLAIAMIFTMMPISLTASAATSYSISTAAELYAFAQSVNSGDANAISGNVTLKADIDLSSYEWVPIGSTTDNAFLGTFDGNGHTISGINCNNNGVKGAYGLFGYVGNEDNGEATVKEVIISNSTFTLTGKNVLCGAIAGCVVSKVGLTGLQTEPSEVSLCASTDSVYINAELTGGTNALGGVVGTFGGTFDQCFSFANITLSTGKKNVNCHVGGVIGRADRIGSTVSLTTKTEITNLYFAGRISSDSTSSKCYVGGVIGGTMDKDTLIESVIDLDLTTTEPIVENAYSAGTLSAVQAGGVTGYNLGGEFTDCYYHADSASYAYINQDPDDDTISTVSGDTFTDELDKSNLRVSVLSNKFDDSSTSYPYPVLGDDIFDDVNATLTAPSGTAYNPYEIDSVEDLKAVADHPDWNYEVTADFGVGTRTENVTAYYAGLTSAQKQDISEKLKINDSEEATYTAATYSSTGTFYIKSGETYTEVTNDDLLKQYAFKDGVTYYTAADTAVEDGTAYDSTITYYTDSEATVAATDADFDISYVADPDVTYYTKSTSTVYGEVTLVQLLALKTAQENTLISAGLATADNFADGFTIDPIPSFTGSINGNNHTITGMTIDLEDTDGTQTVAALINKNCGDITNLTFKNTTIAIDAVNYETVNGQYYAATVAAYNYGTISGVTTDACITITNGVGNASKSSVIGGIAAVNYGTVSSAKNTGIDLFKLAENTILDDEDNQNYATVEKSTTVIVGGIVGLNEEGGAVTGCSSVNTARSELVGVTGVNVGTFCGLNDDETEITGTTLADTEAVKAFLKPYDPGENASTDDMESAAVTTGFEIGNGTMASGYPTGEIKPGSGKNYDLEQRVVITAKDTAGNTYNTTYFRFIKIALKDITVEIDTDKLDTEYYVTGKFSNTGISVTAYKGTENERTLAKVSSADKQGYTVHIYTDAACTQEFTDTTFSVAGTYYVQLRYGDNILIKGVNTDENRTEANVDEVKYIATFEVYDIKSIDLESADYSVYMAGQTPTVSARGTMGTTANKTVKMSQSKFPYVVYVDNTANGTFSFNPKKTADEEVDYDKIYYSDAECTKAVDKPTKDGLKDYYEATAEIYIVYTYDWYATDGSGDLGTPDKEVKSNSITVNVIPSNIKVDTFTATNSSDTDSEVSCQNIKLDWTSEYDTDIKYVVTRKVSGADDETYNEIYKGDKDTYTDTSAIPGTTYTYKITMLVGGALSTESVTVDKLCPLPTSVVADTYNVRVAMNKSYDGKDGVNSVTATWANGTSTELKYKDKSSEAFNTLCYYIELNDTFDSTTAGNEYTATVQYMADGSTLSAVKSASDNTKDATFKILVVAPTSISATTTYTNYPSGYTEGKFIASLTVRSVYDYEEDTENNYAALYNQQTISDKANSNNIYLVDYDSTAGLEKDVTVAWKCDGVDDPYTTEVTVNFYDLNNPSNLKVTTGGTGENTVTWDAVAGADSYTVYRTVKPTAETEEDYSKCKTITATSTLEYVDEKAESGVTYVYKVITTIADMSSDGATAEVTTKMPDFIKLVSLSEKAKVNYVIGDDYKKPSNSQLQVYGFYRDEDATKTVYELTTDEALDANKSYYVVDATEESGYKIVAKTEENLEDIGTYYEQKQVACTDADFSDADFADVEDNEWYLSRQYRYSATNAAYKFQLDTTAFDNTTVGKYTIKVQYNGLDTYAGHEIGSYDVNVYDLYKLSVTTNAKTYEAGTDFSDVTFTVKAVYGDDKTTAKEEVLTDDAWQITSDTTDIMKTAGEKTVEIALKDNADIKGTVTFTVYDPGAIITPKDDTGITRQVETVENNDAAVLVVSNNALSGIDITSFITSTNFENAPTCLKVYQSDGSTEVTSGKLATGYIVKLFTATDVEDENFETPLDTAYVAVKGDVNGDGKISAKDFGKIKTYIMEGTGINTVMSEIAADFNGDGKISAKDYGKIKTLIMAD